MGPAEEKGAARAAKEGVRRAGGDKPRYQYRRPATPGGIERMARGDLEHFDLEMYANLNTGVLEEYLEEKNRRESFTRSRWDWGKILLGVLIGTVFAAINQYVGLKIGLIVAGAWYVTYLLGLALRWEPTEMNLASGASVGTSYISTGFVYTYPALFLLSSYAMATPIIPDAYLPSLTVAIVATALAGFLGASYFILFRRVWLVEDPLPYPTFESFVKLLDMGHAISEGAAERARHAVRLVGIFTGVSALFALLRDLPVASQRGPDGALTDVSAMTYVFDGLSPGSAYQAGGIVGQPLSTAQYTSVGMSLSPLLVAVGWFMRLRAALIISLGAFFVWLLAIPLAVAIGTPVFVPHLGTTVALDDLAAIGEPAALFAFNGLFRTMAAGAILGGGLTALIKMTPTIRRATRDLFALHPAPGKGPYVPGRGWFEWPPVHILVLLAVCAVALPGVFVLGGYPLLPAVAFTLILCATTFVLGAIAVKVLGETSLEPVSGTSILVFLLTFGTLSLFDMPTGMAVAMALLGASVFGAAITMTGNVMLDFKNGLYVGTRPYHQFKAEVVGIIPGAVVGGLAATVLSIGLASGTLLHLAAPQANAFATLVQALLGGHVNYSLFVLGIGFGVVAELATGMGTAFGFGMMFHIATVVPLLLGGAARELYERYLTRTAEREGWEEEKRTIRVLDSYMVATGLIVGEALIGTGLALYLSSAFLL